MKICTQCKVEKDYIEFPKKKSNKDGLYSWCKECSRKKTREHSLKNPDAVKASREKRKKIAYEKSKIYKKLNSERITKQRKLHYEANKEVIKEKARIRGKNITEEEKQRKKEYYQKWKKTEAGKNYTKSRVKYRKVKYRKHYMVGQKVKDAIKSGKLIKPEKCSICNSMDRIEGHHADYDKPLDVIWVCKKCHMMIHKNLKEVS